MNKTIEDLMYHAGLTASGCWDEMDAYDRKAIVTGSVSVNKHCKDCKYYHNAGHPNGSNLGPRYNDWCVKFSNTAKIIVEHCKLNAGKVLK